MDIKLIISTFFVIFLAELGDKTQLAAMAASAGSNKPFAVLLGAVLALSLSSLLAVVVGSVIGKYIPERYIKIAAGILFIVFGALYIKESFSSKNDKKETSKQQTPVEKTFLGESVIKTAEVFERQEMQMLETAGNKLTGTKCKTVITKIIAQEQRHLEILSGIGSRDGFILSEEPEAQLLLAEPYSCREADIEILQDVYERETAMASFYRLMSEKSKIGSMRSILYNLHLAELNHAESIGALCDGGHV